MPETPQDVFEDDTEEQNSSEMSPSFFSEQGKIPHTERANNIWAPSQLHSQLEDETESLMGSPTGYKAFN